MQSLNNEEDEDVYVDTEEQVIEVREPIIEKVIESNVRKDIKNEIDEIKYEEVQLKNPLIEVVESKVQKEIKDEIVIVEHEVNEQSAAVKVYEIKELSKEVDSMKVS